MTIPNYATKIGAYAFSGCSALYSVVIPETVDYVGSNAFSENPALKIVQIRAKSPATVSKLAFADDNIETVNYVGTEEEWNASGWPAALPSVTPTFNYSDPYTDFSVESGVLKKYKGLAAVVTIPDRVTSIGASAFLDCTSLKDVTIPSSVTSVGIGAFDGCTSLSEIKVAEGSNSFCAADGVLFNKDKTELLRYPQGKAEMSYSVPETVTTIRNGVFYYSHLTSVTLPSSLLTMEHMAFARCASLESITIPSGVTSVDGFVFSYSTAIKTVNILAKSASVTDSAFNGCKVETVNYAGTEDEWNASGWKNVFGDATVNYNYGALAVTQQPADVSGAVNDKVTFTVAAEGDDLSYQWYYKKANESIFTAWNKKTEASATTQVYASWDKAQFYCVVKDGNGNTVQSDTVTLTVVPKITAQPVNVSGAVNDTATFTVKATGAGLTYQWYYKKSGEASFTAWNKKTSATASTPIYNSWNGAQFYCVVKDGNGASLTSDTVTLTVVPKITAQPANVSGAVNSTAKFSLTATGSNLTYQWYYKKSGASAWTKWNNQTTNAASLTVYNSWNNAQFYCEVKNGYGNAVKSNTVKLTVASATLAITTQPSNVSGAVNDTATFSVKATGSGLIYQWYYKKATDSAFTAWNKKTTASVSTPIYASWNKAQFYCIVKDSSGKTVNSNTVTLTVTPKFTQQPANATGAVNGTASFSVKATGVGLTYQWYYKKSGASDWTKWSGKTTNAASLTVYKSWNNAQFYCEVKDSNGKTVKSNTATLTVQ